MQKLTHFIVSKIGITIKIPVGRLGSIAPQLFGWGAIAAIAPMEPAPLVILSQHP